MRHQLRAFAASGSQEALHELRVAIKKVRAFKKFTALYRKERKALQLKKIFHRAGIIREASINLEIMKQYHISHSAFGAEATQILQQASDKFRSRAARYDKHIKKTVKSLLKTIHPVRNSDIRHWFNRQLKRIAAGVTASSVDQLHLARKNIKCVLYVHGILHRRLVDKLKLDVTYLDQLQDSIGKWHDTVVAATTLASGNVRIGRLQKAQDKAGAAVRAISDGFWNKVFQLPQ